MRYDAIILGAGISGLVAAHRLMRAGRSVLVLEKATRAGGAIETISTDGFLIERGPNSLRGTHEFLDLIAELGIEEELVTADPRAPAYVCIDDELHAVPMGPGAALRTGLLSWRGKLRLLGEPFVAPRREESEESIASFVRRRLGPEVLERLVAPFVSGIYAGDVEQLSVQATFARLAEFESTSGSIVRGALSGLSRRQSVTQPAKRRSLRPYRLCSFRQGMKTLPEALAKMLGETLLIGAKVDRVARLPMTAGNPVFEIEATRGEDQLILYADALIVAVPADAASKLTAELSPKLSALLAEIHYNSLVTVPLAYRIEDVGRPLNGFGFLTPRSEGLRTLGSIWNTSHFPGRAPSGWALLNSFIGGSTDPGAVDLPDGELQRIVHEDLRRVLGIKGEPSALPLTRYRRAIPQYLIGHAGRTAKIHEAVGAVNGLTLIGNYLDGVSLGDCIRRAREAADHAPGKENAEIAEMNTRNTRNTRNERNERNERN